MPTLPVLVLYMAPVAEPVQYPNVPVAGGVEVRFFEPSVYTGSDAVRPVTLTLLENVVAPATPRVLDNVVAPVTPSVPPMEVLPLKLIGPLDVMPVAAVIAPVPLIVNGDDVPVPTVNRPVGLVVPTPTLVPLL